MRSIPAAALTKINTQTATEPINILVVEWTGVPTNPITKTYADKEHQDADARIISISGLNALANFQGGGQTVNLNVTLDDSDGVIKNQLDQFDPHKRPVTIYQSYEGLSISSRFLLFEGEINSPVIWDEGTRTVSFSVTNKVESREIGFSPESGTFDYVAPSAIGRTWPICFGEVVRVPAVKITEQIRGKSLTRFGVITRDRLITLEEKIQTYAELLGNIGVTDNIINVADLEVIILNADYVDLVLEISKAYLDWSGFIEDLLTLNPNQTVNLDAFVVTVVDIAVLTFRIQIIGTFLNNLAEDLVELSAELSDLLEARQVEEEKVPFQDPAVLALIDAEIDPLNLRIFGLVALQTSLLNLQVVYQGDITALELTKTTQIGLITTFDLTTITIESNEEFPQGAIEIVVNGARMAGTMASNVFTITNAAVATDTSVTITTRQNSNPNELWISDASISLRNKYCLIQSQDQDGIIRHRVVFVVNQDGARCFFEPVVWEPTTELPDGRQAYGFKFFETDDTIVETSARLLKRWFAINLINTAEDSWVNGMHAQVNSDWGIEIGDDVFFGVDTQEIYIANLHPSTSVSEVMGYRDIDGKRTLVPIPSQYYTIDLSFSIAGFSTTAITFVRPLIDYIGENWEEQIYVSLTSTLSSNPAEIIEFLTTGTGFFTDFTNRLDVGGKIVKFPANFALLEKWDFIALIEEIAWQARIAIWITGTIIWMKYLAEEPSVDLEINESLVEAGSFQMQYSDTDSLVTVFDVEWQDDYSKPEPNKIVLRNNVPKYGVLKQSYKFFIYNIEELVIRSAQFWLIRYSNTWKQVRFRGFLNLLRLEVFDTVELDMVTQHISNGNIKAVVQDVVYDSDKHSLEVRLWTPVRAGEMDPYVFAWPASASATEEYPTDSDLFAGGG